MDAPVKSSRPIWAKIKFAILSTISVTAGFVPLMMFIGRPFWLVWISAFSMLISLAYAARLDAKNERPLTPMESVALTLAALSEGAIMGLMLFLLYGMLWLVMYVIRLLGWRPGWAGDVGMIAIGVVGFILLMGVVGLTADKLRVWLFPKTGIGNAPLLPYANPGEFSPRAFFASLGLIVCVCLSLFVSSYFYILLQIYLIVISTPVAQRLERREPSERSQTLRAAVKTMLRACGYLIVDRLQTRQLELDRLISVFDIVAHRDGYALAIQLKADEQSSDPVGWTEATYLRSATRAIYKAVAGFDIPVHSVLPMLLLCGRKPDSTLTTFAEQESIRIAEMEWATIQDITDEKLSIEKLREIAQSYLGLRAASMGPATTVPVLAEEPT